MTSTEAATYRLIYGPVVYSHLSVDQLSFNGWNHVDNIHVKPDVLLQNDKLAFVCEELAGYALLQEKLLRIQAT